MENFSLVTLLSKVGSRMQTELRDRLISHPAELGGAREVIVREFIRSHISTRFEVSTGFAFDSSGAVSKQLDIIIANSLTCPRFEVAGRTLYYPCESVVAVGQVKSSLTSKAQLREAFANLESMKALDRSAGGTAIDITTNEPIDPKTNHLHQTFTFILITGRALSGDSVREELFEFVQSREPHLWPNVVLALDQSLVTFCCDGGVCPNPMDARGIALQTVSDKHDVLMKFYLLLGRAIEATRVANAVYWDYLRPTNLYDADVWHSCFDNPPPLLSSL